MEIDPKVGLGSVQFGLDYGINNTKGIVPYGEVLKIIECYHTNSTSPLYDTALGYGSSQQVLGNAFKELKIQNPKIVSKFSAEDIKKGIKNSLKQALNDLQIDKLYGFMAHNADDIIADSKVLDELMECKESGLVTKLGVSVYYPKQVMWFIENNIQLDIIQLPYNLFDQRFDKILKKCKVAGIEIHSRSAFMQGLIFKGSAFLNNYFLPFMGPINRINELAKDANETLANLTLTFSLMNDQIDRVIIGVDSRNNLMENCFKINPEVVQKLARIKNELAISNENILLPFNWPKNE